MKGSNKSLLCFGLSHNDWTKDAPFPGSSLERKTGGNVGLCGGEERDKKRIEESAHVAEGEGMMGRNHEIVRQLRTN